jgi:hypothetical protein
MGHKADILYEEAQKTDRRRSQLLNDLIPGKNGKNFVGTFAACAGVRTRVAAGRGAFHDDPDGRIRCRSTIVKVYAVLKF